MPSVRVKLFYYCVYCDLEYGDIDSCYAHERRAHSSLCDQSSNTDNEGVVSQIDNETFVEPIFDGPLMEEDNESPIIPSSTDETIIQTKAEVKPNVIQVSRVKQQRPKRTLTIRDRYEIIMAHRDGVKQSLLSKQYSSSECAV